MTTSLTILNTLKALRSSKQLAGLGEWHSKQMGYRKLGLRFDDMVPEENELVQEAVDRLTPKEFYDRLFRFRRALYLSMKKEELPPAEWTKPEEDVPYLRPILQQVESEIETKQNFENLSEIPPELASRNRVVYN